MLLVVGITVSAYSDSTIQGIQERLGQSGLSQNERNALQGSLDWWNVEKVSFYQPVSRIITTLGFTVILFSIVYAVLSIWYEQINVRRVQSSPEHERTYGQRAQASEGSMTNANRKTGFPIAAGILTIIASSITILMVAAVLVGSAQLSVYSYYQTVYIAGILSVCVWNVLAFSFGLTGGIFSIRRKHFGLSIFGISLLLTSGFTTIVVFEAIAGSAWISGLLSGFPIIILAMLSIIFDSVSKNEFS